MAIIDGTDGNDTLTGTASGDSINGKGGIDIISALAGADYIDVGDGRDDIFAGSENDVVKANYTPNSGGSDIYGGAGNDSLNATPGSDYIYGDLGNDTLWGQSGNDVIYGSNLSAPTTDGSDYISGQDGNDLVSGGYGLDTLFGSNGNDTMYGNAGNDTVYSFLGSDYLDGGADTDRIDATVVPFSTGVHGIDTLVGGTGADGFYVAPDIYNPGSSFSDIKDYATGEVVYFYDDQLYSVFGSGITYNLSMIQAGVDMQLRVVVNQNGFTDDYAVVRNRATNPPVVTPLSRFTSLTGATQDENDVPFDAETFDTSKAYKGEYVKFADGAIGRTYTIEADFTEEDFAAILPGWIKVSDVVEDTSGFLGAPGVEPYPYEQDVKDTSGLLGSPGIERHSLY